MQDVLGSHAKIRLRIAVCRCTANRGRLKVRWAPSAIISAHALGWPIERSHAALVRDFTVLADAGDAGDRIAAGDGSWIVSVTSMHGRDGVVPVRAVRTFHT
jgi:hypothetical protein